MKKTYTVKQVANILGYSTNSIYTFLKEKRIKGVRIGKGRFRISQEELEKLLHLKKNQEPESASLESLVPTSTLPESVVSSEEIPSLNRHVETMKDSIPCLFDWFISLVSIIMGLTMILFVRNFEEFSKVPFLEFLLPMKINFLVAGVGLFFANLFNQTRRKAFFIFYLIIFINCLAFSWFLFLGKDILGSFFFILTSIMILFHTVFNQKGTVNFSVLVTILTVLSPIMMVFFPSVIDLSEITKATGLDQNLIISFWLILVVFVNSFIWLFKKEKNLVYWISFAIISIGLGYFAYLYSAQLYWSRALIYVLLVLFLFILSFWEAINRNGQENQRATTQIFVNIVLIFLVGIGSIWVIQNNIHSYAQNELVNKLVYGRNLTESTIASSQNKLEVLAKNKSLMEAIKKNDVGILNGLIKDLFTYSSSFRRILVADEKGDLLTNYPYANVDYKNIAFRDYFKQVKDKKKSYLSNVFQSSVDGQKRYVVSINVPILDEENNFQGVLIGSFDISSLSNRLQQIANPKDKEYFIMVDKSGDLIISPEYVTKLSQAEIRELLNNVSKGINIEETPDPENILLQVHDKVDDQEWTIAIRRPLFNTYNFDALTNSMLILSLIGFSLSIIYLNIFHLNK